MAVISGFGRSPYSLPHRVLAVCVAVCLGLAMCAPAQAGDHAQEKRVVLALFDSLGSSSKLDIQDRVHLQFELPLNHLGLTVRRHDVRDGPPPPDWLPHCRAVLTAFQSVPSCPDWLWPWLEDEVAPCGVRVVHMGTFGPLMIGADGEIDAERITRWLGRMGLGFDLRFAAGPIGLDIRYHDAALCNYEGDPRSIAVYTGPWNESEANHPWVMLRHILDPGRERTPVVTGPWGGIALNNWVAHQGSDTADNNDIRWFIDPVEFFRESMGLAGVPAPDPCVLNGRRVFFFHVDGDGFESLSTVHPGHLSGQVLKEEVFDRYDLPFTVSVIVGSLTRDLEPTEPTKAMQIAAEILNLPQVEPASHGVLHPFFWQEPLAIHTDDHKVVAYRTLENYEYTPVNEVRESIRFIDRWLMRGDRRCRVMLWTGNTIPPEEAILECGRLDVLNMNGGTLRWDTARDSQSYVMPWGRVLGEAFQVYAGAPNENDYDGFFTTSPGAYLHVDLTIDSTGRRRILKPANIYIHFYSADTPARLANVHELVRKWAFEEPTAPVFASTYIRAVNSAVRTARVARTDAGWALRDFGDCYSARIDGPTPPVDWDRSPGVLGARRLKGALYVHLSAPDADLVFAGEEVPRPHVEEANHLLTDAGRDADHLWFTSSSWARRRVVLAGYPPGADVRVVRDGEETVEKVDPGGRVTVEFSRPGRTRVEVWSP